MSSSASTTTNGVVVVTHVHPHCGGQLGQVVCSAMGKFRQGHPIALGTVQIMFGAMSFLIGIGMSPAGIWNMATISGIFVWGAIIYIIAGSLTVAADKNLNRCLVKASLVMNVIAAVVAFTGTILYSFDASGILNECHKYPYYPPCDQYTSAYMGVAGVMAVFSLLEFMVSISVSSFACKAVCHSTPEAFIIGNNLPQGSAVGPHTHFSNPNHETVESQKGPEVGIPAPPNDVPPQYSPATIP